MKCRLGTVRRKSRLNRKTVGELNDNFIVVQQDSVDLWRLLAVARLKDYVAAVRSKVWYAVLRARCELTDILAVCISKPYRIRAGSRRTERERTVCRRNGKSI